MDMITRSGRYTLRSWSAETVLRIRSRELAEAFILSSLVDTTKLSAPISLAAASLFGEVDIAYTVLPEIVIII